MTPLDAEDIFFAARGMAAPERGRFVREACGEDAAVRAEVEALLAADHQADTVEFLTGSEPRRPELPDRIGPYRILREIGRGGQAIVYLAHDDALDRPVALKVLRNVLADSASTLVRRFRREATAMANLEHPGLCTVYDTGMDDRVAWIAMRYVEGQTLAELLASEDVGTGLGLPTGSDPEPSTDASAESGTHTARARSQLLRFFEAAARALHVAHEQGLVHRDVKPGNLMVTEAGEPVLLDFGIAHAVDASDLGGLTRTTDVLGTPAYLPPELLRGQPERIGPSLDVYGLGVTMYECLTRRRPYEAVSRDGLYQQILTVEPVPPRRIDPRIPRDLEVVVLTAMEKQAGRRYQTAADLADELRRVREHEPIRARPVSPLGRTLRWARRQPALAGSLTIAFLALSVGLAVSLSFWSRSEAQRLTLEVGDALRDVETQLDVGEVRRAERRLASTRNFNGFAREYLQAKIKQRIPDRWPRHDLYCVDWSEDGRHTLACQPSETGPRVVVRSWADRKVILEQERTELGLFTAIFTPDGRQILIIGADADGTLELVDLESQKTVARSRFGSPIGPERYDERWLWVGRMPGYFAAAAFSRAPGGALVIGGQDGTLRRFDPRTLDPLPGFSEFERGADSLNFLRFSQRRRTQGERILVGDEKGRVRVLDERSGALVVACALDPATHDALGGALDASIDPEERWLIGTGTDGKVSVFDLESGALVRRLAPHIPPDLGLSWGYSARFCPVAPFVITAGQDMTAQLYSTNSWRKIATLPAQAARFVGDGTTIVGVSRAGGDHRWNLSDMVPATVGGLPPQLRGLAIAPDGHHVFTVNSGEEHERGVRKWDLRDGRQVLARLGDGFAPLSVAVSPDGDRVAIGCMDQRVVLMDAHSGEILRELRAPQGWIEKPTAHRPPVGFHRVKFSPSSNLLAVGLGTTNMNRDNDLAVPLILFDTASGEARRLDGLYASVDGLAFDRTGIRLAASAKLGKRAGVLVWEVATGKAVGRFSERNWGISDLAFSPVNGNLAVAGAGPGGRGLLLELDSNYRVRWRLSGGDRPQSRVRRVAYLDGEHLVTADGNLELAIWEIESRARHLTVPLFQTAVKRVLPYALAVTPDSRRILVGGLTGSEFEVFETIRPKGSSARALHAAAARHVDALIRAHGSEDRVRKALEDTADEALKQAAIRTLAGFRGR